jgi:hypothetical protein
MGDLMKKIIKKIFGIDKIEAQAERSLAIAAEAAETATKATKAAERAKQAEETAKQTPKQRATAKGEPYIAVLETHVNKENLRNGFLELDWNDEFVLQLKQQGYGFDGDPDEEIVDRWFRTLCRDIAGEEGVDMTERGAGYINVKKIAEGKSEVS